MGASSEQGGLRGGGRWRGRGAGGCGLHTPPTPAAASTAPASLVTVHVAAAAAVAALLRAPAAAEAAAATRAIPFSAAPAARHKVAAAATAGGAVVAAAATPVAAAAPGAAAAAAAAAGAHAVGRAGSATFGRRLGGTAAARGGIQGARDTQRLVSGKGQGAGLRHTVCGRGCEARVSLQQGRGRVQPPPGYSKGQSHSMKHSSQELHRLGGMQPATSCSRQ